jgi:hypothetical protein
MHSSRGPPAPHGATPSPPTDRPHSNTHTAIPDSFHTPESASPASSPPFFTMNPLTDQRLTGSMMPYHPVDHHHALPRYAHVWCSVCPTPPLLIVYGFVPCLTTPSLVHPPTKIPFRGSTPRRGMLPCWTQVPLPNTRLQPHCTPSAAWSLQATRAVLSRLHYRPREQQYIPATPFSAPPIRKCCCSTLTHHSRRTFVYIHTFQQVPSSSLPRFATVKFE